jgi:sulfatase maturation enzyme AslB (radical SAM superfamily)
MNKSWCSLAWNHHFIGPGGNCKPCCRFKGQEVPSDHNLSRSSLEDLFHDAFMFHVRRKMMLGQKMHGCDKCYEEEDSGKRASLRQIYNRLDLLPPVDTDKPKILFLESAFSNICDLQCVMCMPYFSTAWGKQDLTGIEDLVSSHGRLNIDVDSIKSIIPDLMHMKFTGGEPLLTKEYMVMLEERAKHPGIENVFLNYSTNLMHFPSSPMIDIWKRVKFIEIATSFDGVGDVIEYVRFPSKWDKVSKNVIRFMMLSHIMDVRVGMRSTIMPYNILDLPNMMEWWVNAVNKHYKTPFQESSWINPTHVAQPLFLTLKVLPRSVKDMITERLWDQGITKKMRQCFNHLCSYMNSEDHSYLLDDFKRYTKVMDKRGPTFEQICPELYNEIF